MRIMSLPPGRGDRASRRDTSASSLKGRHTPSASCQVSWPLPATRTTSSLEACSTAKRSAERRIALDSHRAGIRHPLADLFDDPPAVLASRIVVGDDEGVRQRRGHRPHLRAFPAVALSPASEHAPQAAPGLVAERAQHALERDGRMGVVDHHQGPALRASQALHAARYRLHRRKRPARGFQGHVQSQQHRESGEQILGVEAPQEGRSDDSPAPRRVDDDLEARCAEKLEPAHDFETGAIARSRFRLSVSGEGDGRSAAPTRAPPRGGAGRMRHPG